MNKALYIFLVVAIFLSRCTIKPRSKIVEVPAPKTISGEIPEYSLGFGDVIEVKFFNNERFNERIIVRPDGRISMEKVGDIRVAGITPAELSKVISDAYGSVIRDPEVTVIVREFGGQQVYVLGEVKAPGAFPLQRRLTVLQSIALAGGQKETANLKSVLLLRRNQDGTIGIQRIDMSLKSGASELANDFVIEAYDIIYVPKTFIANVNAFLDQALAGIIQPLDVYLRAAWLYKWR